MLPEVVHIPIFRVLWYYGHKRVLLCGNMVRTVLTSSNERSAILLKTIPNQLLRRDSLPTWTQTSVKVNSDHMCSMDDTFGERILSLAKDKPRYPNLQGNAHGSWMQNFGSQYQSRKGCTHQHLPDSQRQGFIGFIYKAANAKHQWKWERPQPWERYSIHNRFARHVRWVLGRQTCRDARVEREKISCSNRCLYAFA